MDDQLLLNASQEEVDQHMALFRSMGVDRLRVSAFWEQLVPNPQSRTKPDGFDGANHLDPRYQFAALDRVVTTAPRHGLRVMLTISTPTPIWASLNPELDNSVWKPNPAEFAAFTTALVTRYAPFVDQWGISNEPNQGSWLQPQTDRRGRLVSPTSTAGWCTPPTPVSSSWTPTRLPSWASWPPAAATTVARRRTSARCAFSARWPAATAPTGPCARRAAEGFDPFRSTPSVTIPISC